MAYVLVVDDEGDSREFLSRFLGRMGHQVACAEDGQDALLKLIEGRPDAMVLDMRMPRIDGVGLLEIMRSYLRWNALPVVILSAHATPEQLRLARGMGVEHIFHKASFELTDLAKVIDDITGQQVNSLPTN